VAEGVSSIRHRLVLSNIFARPAFRFGQLIEFVTYFFLNFMMPDAIDMFAKEVMPEFAR
jgi:hypothetical protein